MLKITSYLIVLLSVSIPLLFTQNLKADSNGLYGIRGAGLVTCSIYNQEREIQSQVYHMLASWMDGYITATNQHSKDTYDIASFESTEFLAALVHEHCKMHPETIVFSIVSSLTRQFSKNKLDSPSKKIEIVIGDRHVLLYQEVIVRMLKKLSQLGFYQGEFKTEFNLSVQKAIQAYQTSINFKATGFPDQLTLWRLFFQSE